MSTSPKNRITRSEAPKSVFPSAIALVDSTISYNQGDLMYLDTATHLIKPMTLETQGNLFLGIATETVVSGKLKRPYTTDVDASQAISDIPGPQFGVVAKLILKSGDSLTPGSDVYSAAATSAQTVQAAGTKVIGVYQGPSVTGDGVLEVEVYLTARFPGDIQHV